MRNLMIKKISPAVICELDNQASKLNFKGKAMSRNQLAKLILENEMKKHIVSTDLEEIDRLKKSVDHLTDVLEKVLESNNELITLIIDKGAK